MNEKILTVIVPSYNMEAYLPKCLGSLVCPQELMERLEVIVVNDGSKDRTSEIAHEFETKYPGTFKVIDKPNGNYGSCINAAIEVAAGRYIRILDADDSVDTDGFKRYLVTLSQEVGKGDLAADLVVTDYVSINSEDVIIKKHDYGIWSGCRFPLSDVSNKDVRFTIHSVTYKLANVKTLGYRQTEGVSYTDTEWIVEPMVNVESVFYLPIVVTRYLVGRAGQTTEDETFAKKFDQVRLIAENMLGRYDMFLRRCKVNARDYYRRQMSGVLRMVYHVGLFGWEGYEVRIDLRAFDCAVSMHQDLSLEVSEYEITPKLLPALKYVKCWRDQSFASHVTIGIYRMYVKVFTFFKKVC